MKILVERRHDFLDVGFSVFTGTNYRGYTFEEIGV